MITNTNIENQNILFNNNETNFERSNIENIRNSKFSIIISQKWDYIKLNINNILNKIINMKNLTQELFKALS